MQEIFAFLLFTIYGVIISFILVIVVRVYQALTIYVIKNSEYYYSPYALFLNKVKSMRNKETVHEDDIDKNNL